MKMGGGGGAGGGGFAAKMSALQARMAPSQVHQVLLQLLLHLQNQLLNYVKVIQKEWI